MTALVRLSLRWRLLELCTGLSTMLWGLWLLWPPFGNSFALTRSLSLLTGYANENPWGVAFTLAGALLFFGALSGRKWITMLGALLVMWGRLFLVVLAISATGGSASSIPDFSVWALLALISMMRAWSYGH